MNCDKVREMVVESLITGNDLTETDHIAACPECHRFLEVQRTLDIRFAEAAPNAKLSPGFRHSLRSRIEKDHSYVWSESLPDIAHLVGCGVGIIVLLFVLPQYSRIVLLAGGGLTAVTYFLQTFLEFQGEG